MLSSGFLIQNDKISLLVRNDRATANLQAEVTGFIYERIFLIFLEMCNMRMISISSPLGR